MELAPSAAWPRHHTASPDDRTQLSVQAESTLALPGFPAPDLSDLFTLTEAQWQSGLGR